MHIQLARGLLAGNVFDWGAKEIRELLETGHFSFKDAQNKLQGDYVTDKMGVDGRERFRKGKFYFPPGDAYAAFWNVTYQCHLLSVKYQFAFQVFREEACKTGPVNAQCNFTPGFLVI